MSDNGQYAGFWARVAASSLDMSIIVLIALALGMAGTVGGEIVALAAGVINFFVALLYGPVLESSARQATFGKQMLGLQVTDVEGNRTSFLRALGRNLAKIISYIPLCIGFLMVAFTAKKQGLHDMVAGCVVVRTGPSHLLKAILITVLGTAVMAGAGGAYVYYVLMPQIKGELMGGLDDAMKGGAMKPQPAPAPRPAPAPQAAAPKPAAPAAAAAAAAAEFDALAGAPLSGYDKPNTVRAGPAILELGAFFPTSLWVKVNLPQIRNIDVGSPPEVTVTKVLDGAGKNWYDPTNTFEKDPFFRRARLSAEAKPVPHLTGTRTVNLQRGLSEGSLQTVEGELRVFIPVDVKTESFEAADIGKDKTVHGAVLTLKSIKGGEAVLRYNGPTASLLAMRGSAGGKPVDIESRQLPGNSLAVNMDLQVKFKGPVTKVEAVIAASVAERVFPFVLTRGGTAGAAPVSTSTGKPEAQAPAAKPAAATAAEDKMADKPKAAPARKPAASSGAEPQAAPARKPAPEPQPAKPAPPPAPRCVIKPVMTDAEIDICRNDRSPGMSAAPPTVASAPTAAAPVKPVATPEQRSANCVIKPIMTAQDMEACRRN